MKRQVIFTLFALCLTPSLAFAKTFSIPEDNPVATVTIPDKWSPDTYDGGAEGTSADGSIYVAIEMVSAADAKSATEDGLQFYADNGVKIDPSSMTSKDITINDLPGFDMAFTGRDKDGPTNVSLTLVQTKKKGKYLMLYFWGSDAGEKDNVKDLQAISDSIQATK